MAIDVNIIGKICREFEESDLPFKVDVVDMASLKGKFKKVVEKERVLLSEERNFKNPKIEQQKISKIIGSLEDKIEINQRLNNTLENIAQAIFKSWFIDFDPVHAKKLAIEAGFSKKRAERAAMAVISGICDPSDFVESFRVMDKLLTQKLQSMSKKKQDELAYTASLFPSEFENSDATVPRPNRNNVYRQKTVEFPKESRKIYDSTVNLVHNIIANNRIEVQLLRNIRGVLLPKLLIGEIGLSKIKLKD